MQMFADQSEKRINKNSQKQRVLIRQFISVFFGETVKEKEVLATLERKASDCSPIVHRGFIAAKRRHIYKYIYKQNEKRNHVFNLRSISGKLLSRIANGRIVCSDSRA